MGINPLNQFVAKNDGRTRLFDKDSIGPIREIKPIRRQIQHSALIS